MSPDNVLIAQRAYEAFNNGGVEAILAFLDPQIEWRMSEDFSRSPRVFHGHDGVREVLRFFTDNFDDFRVETEGVVAAGEDVVVSVRMYGRSKGAEEVTEFRLVQVWRVKRGRAVRLEVYPDLATAMAMVRPPELQ